MSGFEDDFGEMVESAPPLDDVDLLEPTPVEHTEDTVGELLTQEDVEVKENEIETVAGRDRKHLDKTKNQ